jgi:hypothetical protein
MSKWLNSAIQRTANKPATGIVRFAIHPLAAIYVCSGSRSLILCLVCPMRLLLLFTLTLFGVGCASAARHTPNNPEEINVLNRAAKHFPATKAIYCYVPPQGNFAKNTGMMAKMIWYAAKQQQPLVIYSPDPQVRDSHDHYRLCGNRP